MIRNYSNYLKIRRKLELIQKDIKKTKSKLQFLRDVHTKYLNKLIEYDNKINN